MSLSEPGLRRSLQTFATAGFLVMSVVACGGGTTTLNPMPTALPHGATTVTELDTTASGVHGTFPNNAVHSAVDLVSQSLATPSGVQVQLALSTLGAPLGAAERRFASSSVASAAQPARRAAAPGGRYGAGDARTHIPLRVTGVLPRAELARGRAAATAIGTQQNFFVPLAPIDQPNTATYRTLGFTLEAVTPHFSLWIESSIASAYAARAAQLGTDADNALTSDVRWIGLPSTYTANALGLSQAVDTCDTSGAKIGSGPRFIAPYSTIDLLILDPTKLNVSLGGQFNPEDLYPQAAANCRNTLTNEAATITLGLDASITNPDYRVTAFVAHEATHLIQYVNGAIVAGRTGTSPAMTREGIAELSIDFAFGHPDYNNIAENAGTFYLPAPQNYSVLSMTGIENQAFSSGANLGNYGAAYLFMRYIADRYGSGFAKTFFTNDPYTTEAESFAALASAAGAASFTQLFADFGTTLAASTNPIPFRQPYAITSFSLNGTYTGPSDQSTAKTFTFPGVHAVGLLPPTTSAPLFPGGITILDSSQALAGANFTANDPTGILGLGGSIVSQ